MYVRDLVGNEYVTQITYLIEEELNGNNVLSAKIQPNKPNLRFLSNLSEMWDLVDDNETSYKIIYFKKQGEGERLSAEIKAIPRFYDDFDKDRVYEEYNKSLTAKAAFDIIFANSSYFYQLSGDFTAKEWQSFGGGAARLDMFKDAINRYGAEFKVLGNIVYLEKQIGADLNVMYRHRLNASNIVQEVDASSLWTYIKGYGDYGGDKEDGDWKDAKLKREYTSPLAKIPGIGIRHAPPLKNGKIKLASTMDENLKTIVNESLKISVTANIHDLTKQKYPIAQSSVGDRVFLIDERIGLDAEVRVVDRKVLRDWRGNILDVKLTFGSQDITKRHQSNLNAAAKTIGDLMEGREKLPLNALAAEVSNVTKMILGVTSEIDITEHGLIAKDKNNPNYVVVLNSAGLGISQDGGTTFRNAITGRGILAEHILAGTMTAGGNKRIDIADGSIWSYVNNKLTMSFGQYQLDFYHPNGDKIGNFGPGNIIGTDIPGLRLVLDRDEGYFNIGHTVDGIVRSAFRTYSYDGSYYTFVAGPYSDNSWMGVFSSTKIWESDHPRNQSCSLYSAENHYVYNYFGRNGSDSKYQFSYNGSDQNSHVMGYFDKDGFWSRLVRGDSMESGTYKVGSGDKRIHSYSDALGLEFSKSNRILVRQDGSVNIFANGSMKHSFKPDGSKSGGSIEIDGENLGMSPIDSPQVLIEYIVFDQVVTEEGVEVMIDEQFLKSVGGSYAVFPSSDVEVEKKKNSVFLRGNKTVDIRLVGKRVHYQDEFWLDMSV
ncbi:phage tail protein [Bacillus cereus]|uniref:phage tail protein n=1 Tax=Bacillus cereus TaxID=1396 RepID=UPI0024532356|nr:phage tail protein [Bacillus cereus]MDH4419933.1 phage tail protein [Bacillus cereus]